jgi:hypothetical protein
MALPSIAGRLAGLATRSAAASIDGVFDSPCGYHCVTSVSTSRLAPSEIGRFCEVLGIERRDLGVLFPHLDSVISGARLG